MRPLPIPDFEIQAVLTSCIDDIDDAILRERFQAAQPEILSEEARYRQFAQLARLDRMAISATVNGDLSVKEMKALYKDGMSSAKGPARSIYDALMSAAPHGTCPLCGQGKVRNLDHHLPQSRYPALVVTPINLVPACRDCNMAKVMIAPTAADEQTIHPYFDDFTQNRWLHADVVESNPPALIFKVNPPEEWTDVDGQRARRHMRVFKLGAAFTLYAAEELSQIAPELEELHTKGGDEAVQIELLSRAQRREVVHRNSWQTAMFYALSESRWFWTEGLFHLRPTSTHRFAA